MQYVRVPKMVNELMQIGFWEVDEAALMVAGVILGIMVDMLITGFICGVFLSGIFAKYKQGKNRGFLLHYLYWHGLLPLKNNPFDISDKKFWVK